MRKHILIVSLFLSVFYNASYVYSDEAAHTSNFKPLKQSIDLALQVLDQGTKKDLQWLKRNVQAVKVTRDPHRASYSLYLGFKEDLNFGFLCRHDKARDSESKLQCYVWPIHMQKIPELDDLK